MTSSSLAIAPANTADFRLLAKKRLPRQLFDYIDGGSYQEITLANNINAFAKLFLRQKILRDVSKIDLGMTLFNHSINLPIILGPIGLAGCFARRGEQQALTASVTHNIPFCLSTVGICSIEELKAQTEQAFWFQLYVIKDRNYAINLLSRAKNAGCETLILTVDLPVLGERYRDIRNGLSSSATSKSILSLFKRGADVVSHPKWLWDVAIRGKPLTFGNLSAAVPNAHSLDDFKGWVDNQFDPSMTWDDLQWIRDNWSGNLIIKGILDSDDAKNAVKLGADAIVVSNHGGRQLDCAQGSLTVLPEIVTAVNKQCKIIIDGGIRSGFDVVKALALGADACLLGRAWAYALAANGEQGVSQLLTQFENELRVAMALTGVTKVSDITSDILVQP
ncbi:FMN-dependent L-lactate dehydrogenase LldD [Colwellia sp. KU-HH00111]|uniref:L-lactate dehydrogenase n=1 Tax=Colwellia sp. KU-HH00111 TaxID=3127652 RepID=UPI003101C5D0